MIDRHGIWLVAACILVADQYGFWWVFAVLGADLSMMYLNGFLSAWQKDREK